jgi:hypothetical protein
MEKRGLRLRFTITPHFKGRLVGIAGAAGKREVVHLIRTAPRYREDMLYFKREVEHLFRSVAVLATVVGTFGNRGIHGIHGLPVFADEGASASRRAIVASSSASISASSSVRPSHNLPSSRICVQSARKATTNACGRTIMILLTAITGNPPDNPGAAAIDCMKVRV